MPLPANAFNDGWRKATIPGIGEIEVRRALMRDMAAAPHDRYWWIRCARCLDGTPLLEPGTSAEELRADVGNAIIEEVMADRFTQAQSGDCGELPLPSCA